MMSFCKKCGEPIEENQQFCLSCGAYQNRPVRRPESELADPVPDCSWRASIPSCRDYWTYKRHYYWLIKKGLLELADKKYTVRVHIDTTNQTATLKLLGAFDQADVIDYLLMNRYLDYDPLYSITNWYGEVNGSTSFICEHDGRVLIVENPRAWRNDIVCLYGCPNAKILEKEELRKTTEILFYDK